MPKIRSTPSSSSAATRRSEPFLVQDGFQYHRMVYLWVMGAIKQGHGTMLPFRPQLAEQRIAGQFRLIAPAEFREALRPMAEPLA